MYIIDGKKLSKEILAKVRTEVAGLSFQPVFCDVLVGNDPASVQYVGIKKRVAEEVGIGFHEANFPESISTEDLINEVKKLNNIKNMRGIIVQLPLPKHIDQQAILNTIFPKLDVDCLGQENNERFYQESDVIAPPAALACLALLDYLNISLQDKKVAVLGQGILVGRPVTRLLNLRNIFPSIVTKNTPNKEEVIRQADVIISGIGRGRYLKGDMLKSGVVLIDAGASEFEGSIVGDVDLDSVKNMAGYISPVPGGVGPVTVAMLFQNVLRVARDLSIK